MFHSQKSVFLRSLIYSFRLEQQKKIINKSVSKVKFLSSLFNKIRAEQEDFVQISFIKVFPARSNRKERETNREFYVQKKEECNKI